MEDPVQKLSLERVWIIDDAHINQFVDEMLLRQCVDIEKLLMEEEEDKVFRLLEKINSKEEVPDLLIRDTNIPAFEGVEFVRKFDMLPSFIKDHCTVMLITPYDRRYCELVKESLEFPFVAGILDKPLNPEQFKKLWDKFWLGNPAGNKYKWV